MNIPKFSKAIEALKDIKELIESPELAQALEDAKLGQNPSFQDIVNFLKVFRPLATPAGEALKAFTNDETDKVIDQFVLVIQTLSVTYEKEQQAAMLAHVGKSL